MPRPSTTALVLIIFTAGLLSMSCDRRSKAPHAGENLPPLMLWAWHGAHALPFIDADTQGVAFLAGTVTVQGDVVSLQPGAQDIDAPPTTVLLPVVRIEIEPWVPNELGEETLEEVATAVLGFSGEQFPGLQLDFDATLSQRAFYAALLAVVRSALGQRFLSVTALPSWCLGDPWLPVGLIDELVPMTYRMGRDADLVRRRFASGRDFGSDCRQALGVSTDEPVPELVTAGRRLYLFSPQRWSSASVDDLLLRISGGST